MFPILLILFILAPIAEIYVLIKVGGLIGALPTVGVVIGTAILGAALLRIQGIGTLRRLQAETAAGGLPAVTLVEGACLLVAGVLLLTPGFITDAIGFCCLIPPLRRALATALVARIQTGIVANIRASNVRGGANGPDFDPRVDPRLHPGAGPGFDGRGRRGGGRVIEGEAEPVDPN